MHIVTSTFKSEITLCAQKLFHTGNRCNQDNRRIFYECDGAHIFISFRKWKNSTFGPELSVHISHSGNDGSKIKKHARGSLNRNIIFWP